VDTTQKAVASTPGLLRFSYLCAVAELGLSIETAP
jgi:hypothetical protein